MAIADGSLSTTRRMQIRWFESDPPADAVAALGNGFTAMRLNEVDLGDPRCLAGVSAVVFVQQPKKLKRIAQQLQDHASKVLDWGCEVILQPAPGNRRALTHLVENTALGGLAYHGQGEPPHYPRLSILDEGPSKWSDAVMELYRMPSAPAPFTSLQITLEDGKPISCKDRDKQWLLQRAFFDCERVFLTRLTGGLSGADVFVAHPTLLRTYTGGRRPLPYFVKIDAREKIITEYKNYQERVDPHVPFHLGPHLIPERCGLGASRGIIVGDFIEESESLVDCARAGRAAPAIACLFNRTLQGWHRDALKKSSSPEKFVNGAYRPFVSSAATPRRTKIAQLLGARLSVDQLNSAMVKADLSEMFVGPIHGDLNAKNVRVRGGDAIIIDFLDHRDDGDVLWDAANLEASLFLDGFAKQLGLRASLRDVRLRLHQLSPIYKESLTKNLFPLYPDPGDAVSWYFDCVRQIRRYAAQWECHRGQYASLLARAFMKKAFNFSMEFDVHEEHRRAAAYVIAEQILVAGFDAPRTRANREKK